MFENLNVKAPSETTIRSCLKLKFEEHYDFIKKYFYDKYYFIMIDETQFFGRKFINIIMGDMEELTKYFLVDVIETVLSVKNVTITIAVDDIIKEFNLNKNKFILLQTDSARYMIKARENLKLFYPNILHTICFAHILHNCAQKRKLNYRKVDDIIASMKGLTVKNQSGKMDLIISE
ncbi:hypothetical protein DMUE_0271 [Dictyocoela muelleri]|nr:hypothetical protein DMUE_0271 [Dictyocoela muelleri]